MRGADNKDAETYDSIPRWVKIKKKIIIYKARSRPLTVFGLRLTVQLTLLSNNNQVFSINFLLKKKRIQNRRKMWAIFVQIEENCIFQELFGIYLINNQSFNLCAWMNTLLVFCQLFSFTDDIINSVLSIGVGNLKLKL